jgi:glutathione S-transferase
MIELHEFPATWGINPSPFCVKIEAHLRLAGIPYTPVAALPFRAPRGKLPFIVDDGQRISDSGHIIEHLRQTAKADLDVGLDERQRSIAHLLRRTCEESLYFVLLFSRWIDEAGWAVVRPAFFATLPPGARQLIAPLARWRVRKSLHAQGYGRHTPKEIYALGAADLDAISAQLGVREFAVADHPTSIDAVLYAFLLSILYPPVETPLKLCALEYAALKAYTARVDRALRRAAQH